MLISKLELNRYFWYFIIGTCVFISQTIVIFQISKLTNNKIDGVIEKTDNSDQMVFISGVSVNIIFIIYAGVDLYKNYIYFITTHLRSFVSSEDACERGCDGRFGRRFQDAQI